MLTNVVVVAAAITNVIITIFLVVVTAIMDFLIVITVKTNSVLSLPLFPSPPSASLILSGIWLYDEKWHQSGSLDADIEMEDHVKKSQV